LSHPLKRRQRFHDGTRPKTDFRLPCEDVLDTATLPVERAFKTTLYALPDLYSVFWIGIHTPLCLRCGYKKLAAKMTIRRQ